MHGQVAPARLHLIEQRLQLVLLAASVARDMDQRPAFRRELRESRVNRVVQGLIDAQSKILLRLRLSRKSDVEARRDHRAHLRPDDFADEIPRRGRIDRQQDRVGRQPRSRMFARRPRHPQFHRVLDVRLQLPEFDSPNRAVDIESDDAGAGDEVHARSNRGTMQGIDDLLPALVDIDHAAQGPPELSKRRGGAHPLRFVAIGRQSKERLHGLPHALVADAVVEPFPLRNRGEGRGILHPPHAQKELCQFDFLVRAQETRGQKRPQIPWKFVTLFPK